MFEYHIRAFIASLIKTAEGKPERGSPLHRLSKVNLKQVLRLSDALSSMTMFKQGDDSKTSPNLIDNDLKKLVKEY